MRRRYLMRTGPKSLLKIQTGFVTYVMTDVELCGLKLILGRTHQLVQIGSREAINQLIRYRLSQN